MRRLLLTAILLTTLVAPAAAQTFSVGAITDMEETNLNLGFDMDSRLSDGLSLAVQATVTQEVGVDFAAGPRLRAFSIW